MIGISLTAEQVRAAPPDVRHWIEQQIAALLTPAAEVPPEHRHLAVLNLGDAQAVLEQIGDFLPAVSVFFELGREHAGVSVEGMRVFRLAELLRQTRLHSAAQVIECLDVINEALRAVRQEPDAIVCGVDREGRCVVAEATSHAILTLWQGIVASRGSQPAAKPTSLAAMPAELSD